MLKEMKIIATFILIIGIGMVIYSPLLEASTTSQSVHITIVDVPLDTTSPSAIADLSAQPGTNAGEVNLTWTATGDDDATGTASAYIIKYAQSLINDTNWDTATTAVNPPSPQGSGVREQWTVTGLTPGATYYFAIKAQDEVPNTSGVSNSPSAVAKIGDIISPTGTITINDGAEYTNSQAVILSLSADDSSGVTEMMFSNDGGTYSSAEPYATTKTWTLTTGDGVKRVYVKYKDTIGNWNETGFSDEIILDTVPPIAPKGVRIE